MPAFQHISYIQHSTGGCQGETCILWSCWENIPCILLDTEASDQRSLFSVCREVYNYIQLQVLKVGDHIQCVPIHNENYPNFHRRYRYFAVNLRKQQLSLL